MNHGYPTLRWNPSHSCGAPDQSMGKAMREASLQGGGTPFLFMPMDNTVQSVICRSSFATVSMTRVQSSFQSR